MIALHKLELQHPQFLFKKLSYKKKVSHPQYSLIATRHTGRDLSFFLEAFCQSMRLEISSRFIIPAKQWNYWQLLQLLSNSLCRKIRYNTLRLSWYKRQTILLNLMVLKLKKCKCLFRKQIRAHWVSAIANEHSSVLITTLNKQCIALLMKWKRLCIAHDEK